MLPRWAAYKALQIRATEGDWRIRGRKDLVFPVSVLWAPCSGERYLSLRGRSSSRTPTAHGCSSHICQTCFLTSPLRTPAPAQQHPSSVVWEVQLWEAPPPNFSVFIIPTSLRCFSSPGDGSCFLQLLPLKPLHVCLSTFQLTTLYINNLW